MHAQACAPHNGVSVYPATPNRHVLLTHRTAPDASGPQYRQLEYGACHHLLMTRLGITANHASEAQ